MRCLNRIYRILLGHQIVAVWCNCLAHAFYYRRRRFHEAELGLAADTINI
jgi:hypothetical protein